LNTFCLAESDLGKWKVYGMLFLSMSKRSDGASIAGIYYF